MRVLPSGSTALLVELDDLAGVLGLYAALVADPLPGVVDVVPAARTVLVVTDPDRTTLPEVADAIRRLRLRAVRTEPAAEVELPVHYDGADLADVAQHWDVDPDEVVRRHTGTAWTVAFCGFAPGFGYCVPDGGAPHGGAIDGDPWDVPRRATPRTTVPAGAVGLAGGFSGVYPRASPGGWQLIGRTDRTVFDLDRDPPALLRPGVRVRFTAVR